VEDAARKRGRTARVRATLRLACATIFSLAASRAHAAPVRRVFEPTDIELEEPGVMEIDMQYGVVRGADADRVSIPDFEIDLGLTRSVELDLDGEAAVTRRRGRGFGVERWAPDNLWTSLKIGLLDYVDAEHDVAWAVGVQLGPSLPAARGNIGVGGEGVGLLGVRWHATQAVLNLGGFVDPAPGPGAERPRAVEGGLDLSQPIAGPWSLTGELGAVGYTSRDPDELTTTAGVAWSPSDALELSIVGLHGWLPGGDQWAVLLGVSPKFRLW
jgi:hypothetical protein